MPGGNLMMLNIFQAYDRVQLHAIPHPPLRGTFPPGEGKGVPPSSKQPDKQEFTGYKKIRP